jgi:hypothetical protein
LANDSIHPFAVVKRLIFERQNPNAYDGKPHKLCQVRRLDQPRVLGDTVLLKLCAASGRQLPGLDQWGEHDTDDHARDGADDRDQLEPQRGGWVSRSGGKDGQHAGTVAVGADVPILSGRRTRTRRTLAA